MSPGSDLVKTKLLVNAGQPVEVTLFLKPDRDIRAPKAIKPLEVMSECLSLLEHIRIPLRLNKSFTFTF